MPISGIYFSFHIFRDNLASNGTAWFFLGGVVCLFVLLFLFVFLFAAYSYPCQNWSLISMSVMVY